MYTNSGRKIMFHILPYANYTYFHERLNILSLEKYMTFLN